MKANHVPRAKRLKSLISKLQNREDVNHIPSPSKGNPYWCCKECGIHDPERYTTANNGEHRKGCSLRGLGKQIAYYKKLLAEELTGPKPV